MTKKLSLVALVLVVACAVAFAGDTKMGMAGKPTMEAMKSEMMKCAVCKHMGAHMEEFGPIGMEAVKLNDGTMLSHWVTSNDAKKIAAYHAAYDEMCKAAEGCASMTDEQVKTQLCSFCQEIHGAMKSGAKMSMGKSKKGDVMVMTSTDPGTQAKIAAIQEKCEMMASMMDMPAGKMAADGK